MSIRAGRRSGWIAACFGLAAAVIVGAAATRESPPLPTWEGVEQAPIRATVLACPPASADRGVDTYLGMLAQALPPGASQPPGTTPARVRVLSAGPSRALLELSSRGALATRTLGPAGVGTAESQSVVVQASGSLAPGLQAWLLARAVSGSDTGLAASRCLSPANQWWFVGTGTKFGHLGKLVLTNADPGTCSLNLSLFGAKGKLSAVGLEGISLAPYSTKVVNLAQLAPRQANLAVSVTTTEGRVFASVKDRWTTALTPTGVDWPAATLPSTDLVVPGIVDGKATNRVVVANPGGSQALVSVELLGANGRFVPKGLSRLQLEPGQVVSRDLTQLAGGGAASVHLTADQPVLAAVETTQRGTGRDASVLGGVTPLRDPGSVPLPFSGALHLLLASPAGPGAAATVVVMTRQGAPLARDEVKLDGGTTSQWELPHLSETERKRAAYVMVRPIGSVVAAAFYEAAHDAVAAVPVESPSFTVEEPTAHLVLTGE